MTETQQIHSRYRVSAETFPIDEGHLVTAECHRCGSHWTFEARTRRWPNGWYLCPKGCNEDRVPRRWSDLPDWNKANIYTAIEACFEYQARGEEGGPVRHDDVADLVARCAPSQHLRRLLREAVLLAITPGGFQEEQLDRHVNDACRGLWRNPEQSPSVPSDESDPGLRLVT